MRTCGLQQSVNGPGYPHNQPFTSLYDGAGNRTQLQTYWGVFTYGYDARNAMTSLVDPGSPSAGIPSAATTWTYEARGLLSRVDNPNTTRTTAVYDANGRALQILHATSAGAPIERAFYSYDPVGNPLTKQTSFSYHTYTGGLPTRCC